VYLRTAGAWVYAAGAMPDTVTAYGVMQDGDYIGPWIFNELRDALKLFVCIAGSVAQVSGAVAEYFGASEGREASPADAKSEAEGDFHFVQQVGTPTILAWTEQVSDIIDEAFYSAEAHRNTGALRVTTDFPKTATVQVWAKAERPWRLFPAGDPDDETEYDGNGEAAATEGVFGAFEGTSVGAYNTTTDADVQIGAATVPVWSDDPAPGAGYTRKGYVLTGDMFAIVRMDVPGGLTYY
jgi:hypothetical protein